MENRPTIFDQIKSIIILPFNALIVVPALLIYLSNENMFWKSEGYLRAVLGILIIGIGVFVAGYSMYLFHKIGRGTPAPWDPPRKFVIQGPYKYTRNPMLTGAILILLGEGILLGSFLILIWCFLFFVGNHIYFVYSEEPRLIKRFGAEYKEYIKKVPRWLPEIKF